MTRGACATKENRKTDKDLARQRKTSLFKQEGRETGSRWNLRFVEIDKSRLRDKQAKKTEKQANCSNNGMKRERLRETGRGRRTRKQRKRQLVGFCNTAVSAGLGRVAKYM